jgi:hypothetical protein
LFEDSEEAVTGRSIAFGTRAAGMESGLLSIDFIAISQSVVLGGREKSRSSGAFQINKSGPRILEGKYFYFVFHPWKETSIHSFFHLY